MKIRFSAFLLAATFFVILFSIILYPISYILYSAPSAHAAWQQPTQPFPGVSPAAPIDTGNAQQGRTGELQIKSDDSANEKGFILFGGTDTNRPVLKFSPNNYMWAPAGVGYVKITLVNNNTENKTIIENTTGPFLINTQGLVVPKKTTTQINAFSFTESGMIVYDMTIGKLKIRNQTNDGWLTASSQWTDATGANNNIYYQPASGNGNVGIGTTDPKSKLDVRGIIGGGGNAGIAIDAFGNVGIGTITPSGLLNIYKAQNVGVEDTVEYPLKITHRDTSGNMFNGMGAGIDFEVSAAGAQNDIGKGKIALIGNGEKSSSFVFYTDNAGASEKRMVIDNVGNVSIGTTDTSAAKLTVAGQIKITGGSPGTNKILTSDENGLAIWQTPATSIGGNGTINYIPKFSAATTITNSQIFDNGTGVGINTNNPSAKLEITEDGTNPGIRLNHGGSNLFATIQGPQNRDLRFDLRDNDNSDDFIFRNAAGTDLFTINRAGTVTVPNKMITNHIKITDGSQGTGKVLQSDANGDGAWATVVTIPGGTAGVNGETLRWNGTNWLAANNLFNNGTNIGIGTTNPNEKLEIEGKIKFGSQKQSEDYQGILNTVDTIIDGSNSKDDVIIAADGGIIIKADKNNNQISGMGAFEVYDDTLPLFKIAENGNVGIGTTAPDQKFVVSNGNVGIGYNDAAQTAKLAINGNVGIGTTNPTRNIDVVKNGSAGIGISAYDNNASNYPYIAFNSADGTISSPASRDANDWIGGLAWKTYGSTVYNGSAFIGARAETDSSDTNSAAYLSFQTAPRNIGTNKERMRITASGDVGILQNNPQGSLHVGTQYFKADFGSTAGSVLDPFTTDNWTIDTTNCNSGACAKSGDSDGWLKLNNVYIPSKSTIGFWYKLTAGSLEFKIDGVTKNTWDFSSTPGPSWVSFDILPGDHNLQWKYISGRAATVYIDDVYIKHYASIIADGRVGIGTSDPQQPLDVNGKSYFRDNVGIGTSTPSEKLIVIGNVSSTGLCLGGRCVSSWQTASGWSLTGNDLHPSNNNYNVRINTLTSTSTVEYDVNTNDLTQYILGNYYDALAFRTPTTVEYTTDGTNWSATSETEYQKLLDDNANSAFLLNDTRKGIRIEWTEANSVAWDSLYYFSLLEEWVNDTGRSDDLTVRIEKKCQNNPDGSFCASNTDTWQTIYEKLDISDNGWFRAYANKASGWRDFRITIVVTTPASFTNETKALQSISYYGARKSSYQKRFIDTSGINPWGGNVGIGTTNPDKKFTLFAGEAQIRNGNLYFKSDYAALPNGVSDSVVSSGGGSWTNTGTYYYVGTYVTNFGGVGGETVATLPTTHDTSCALDATGKKCRVTINTANRKSFVNKIKIYRYRNSTLGNPPLGDPSSNRNDYNYIGYVDITDINNPALYDNNGGTNPSNLSLETADPLVIQDKGTTETSTKHPPATDTTTSGIFVNDTTGAAIRFHKPTGQQLKIGINTDEPQQLLHVNGTAVFTDGNVGIGTTIPGNYKLNVVGGNVLIEHANNTSYSASGLYFTDTSDSSKTGSFRVKWAAGDGNTGIGGTAGYYAVYAP